MKKMLARIAMAALLAAPLAGLSPLIASADSNSANFESPFVLGSISGQQGWGNAVSASVDQAVVANTYGFSSFGSQSFRMSDAYQDGAFGGWVFAKPLTDSVGETAATAGTFTTGTKQTHFEVQFDIASTQDTYQPGMHLSVSPDRGDGSRMSYLRFEDQAGGIHVFFDDASSTGTMGSDTFVESDIATIDRGPHTIKLTMDVLDGPSNDVVKVDIDGVLKKTGTSWEDFYRYDSEQAVEQTPRIVKTVIIQSRGNATNPADLGKGFLIDNFSLLSGPAPAAPTGSIEITKYACPDGTTVTRSANGVAGAIPAGCVLESGKTFGYVHGTQTDANAPFPEVGAPLTAGGVTNGSGVLTIPSLPADGRYLVAETNSSNQQLAAGDILGLYCTGDADTSGNNDNQELTFVRSDGATKCVAYDKAPTAPACNADATQTIVSDTATQDTTDGHPAVAVVPNPAWTSIPSSIWVYSDALNGSGSSPTGTKTFTRTFSIVGTPKDSSLEIAADNMYTVAVNGNPLSTGTSATDLNNYNPSHTWTIPAADLVTGSNTVTFTVTNPAADPSTGVAFGDPNPAGLLYKLTVNNDECTIPQTPTSVKVTIDKYVDGQQAAAGNTGGASFSMHAVYPGGEGDYALSSTGFNNPTPYEATTGDMAVGSNYSTYENLPTTCDAGNPYALVGYTTGSTLAAAAAGTPTLTVPSFTGLQGDKFVVVWNKKCEAAPLIKVHVLKYLDGAKAVTVAGNYLFPMTATWQTANLNGGVSTSGNYVLGNNHGGASDLYGADTAPMATPANYTTSEITDNTSNVVASPELCAPGKYLLKGYKTSAISLADAAAQPTDSLVAPAFTGLTADAYVVVDNTSCPTTGSLTVNKVTIGGNSTFSFTGDNGIAPFQITTASNAGYATLSNLAPGTYTVTEATKSGWTQTSSDCSAVAVTAGGAPSCTITNTNNRLLGAILGTKYEDRDGDGKLKDSDHHRLSGWTIYLDTNNNGALDGGESSTVTDSHGNYRFVGLVAGTYHVREVGQASWTQTYPASGSYNVTLTSGQVAKSKNFGNFHQGTISGMKFNDANGNHRKDTSEAGLAGWTIVLHGPNHTTQTTVTGANGSYSFTGLSAGTYTLTEVQQTGWKQTVHPSAVLVRSGTAATNKNFGNVLKLRNERGHDNDFDGFTD